MVDQKTKTQLEIGVDDRQVKRLGETIRRALDGDAVRRFGQNVRELHLDRLFAHSDRVILRQIQANRSAATSSAAASSRPTAFGGGGGMGGGGGGGGFASTPSRRPLGFGATALAAGVGSFGANALSRAGAGAGGVAGGFGAISSMLGSIPVFGQALAATLHTAESLTDRAVAFRGSMAQHFGQTGLANLPGGLQKVASSLGIGPQELSGRMGELAQTSGLQGRSLLKLAPQELRLERATGIKAGTLAGAAGTSGGQISPERVAELNREAFRSALSAGIREARIGEYVADVAGDISALRSQGILVDPKSIFAITSVLGKSGGAGLRGEAGLSAARTLSEKIRGAGTGGDVFSQIAVQTGMHMRPGKSAVGVMTEMNQHFERFFAPVMKEIVKMAGPKDAATVWLVQNAGLSFQQASDVYDAVKGGKIDQAEVERILAGGPATGNDEKRADDKLAERQQALPKAVGVAASAAALEGQQVGAGEQVAAPVFAGRRAEMSLAKRTAPLGGRLAKDAGGLITGALGAYDKGGMSGLLKYGGEEMLKAFSGIGGMLEKAFDHLNESIGKSLGFGGGVKLKDAFSKKGFDEVNKYLLEGLMGTFQKLLAWLNSMLPKGLQFKVPTVGDWEKQGRRQQALMAASPQMPESTDFASGAAGAF